MSAYMVGNRELSKIARYLTRALNKSSDEIQNVVEFPQSENGTVPGFEGARESDGFYEVDRVHRELWEMNRDALKARYSDGEAMAGEYIPCDREPIDTNWDNRLDWMLRLYMVMRCYRYQCSEGDVQNRPLYKTISFVCDNLGCAAAIEAAKERGIKWGSWS